MSTVDNRVVEMNFDNSKFATGVSGTLSMLDKLKASLGLQGASKGLQEVSAAAQRFDSSAMEQGASRIGGAFTAMQATVFGAMANIGAKISSTALSMASSFTVAPLTAGFQEYELKMGSIQTILANTAKYGTKLPAVNKALDDLNNYADQTIYNFGDMTKNIGLFTNAGIKVEDATTMIKGFSNSAAASGTSAEGAAGAAYQLSQALSAGKVTLMDWRSLQNVGMGNKNMQSGIIELASAMGTFKGSGTDAKKATTDFNGSLEKGWLKADVMSNYLKIMSGDMDDASIAALGLSDTQVKAFRETANTGFDAATKTRTFTQLIGTLKESIGSGWSESFGILLGDFNEATDLFTNMGNAVNGFVGRLSKSRNDVLRGWKDDGGRTALIDGLTEAFWALGAPLAQVGQAFREVFPASTGERLADMTKSFAAFMHEIQASPETLDRLKRTFAGLFAILHIGWTVIKAVGTFLGELFLGFTEGDQGILRFTATIGDFFVGLDKAISSGKGITNFFDKLRDLIFKVLNPIRDAGQMLGKIFEGVDIGPLGASIGKFINSLLSFGTATDNATKKASGFKDAVSGFFDFFFGLARRIADFVEPVTDAIGNALLNINFDQLNDALQTLSLGGIAIFIKQLGGMFKGLEIFKGAGGGIMDKIKGSLDKVTGTLSAMQANLKASMLLKIAGAIALLAVAVVLLASVDAAGLARATGALTVMFIQLGAAMTVFQKIGTIASIAKLNLMGSALILIGIAILILAGAVKVLASMSWEELAKGLGGLIVLTGVIIGLSKGLDRSRGAVLRSAAALVIMGAAIKVLVSSVKELGGMDLVSMAKGLGGVAILLGSIALFNKLQKASKGSIAQAVTLLAMAAAIRILADAVKIFATMTWEELSRGFAGVAAGLILIGAALKLMPQGAKTFLIALSIAKVAGALGLIAVAFKAYDTISWETIAKGILGMGVAMGILVLAMKYMPKIGAPQAVGLLMVASAIGILSKAVLILGSMNLAQVAQGLGALASILTMLTVALNQMEGSDRGALALIVIATALRVLLPVITTLGAMPIGAIVLALVALSGVFVVLAIAAKILEPAVPVLMGLGIAVALLGAAMFLAGAGVALFAVGLTALAAAGGAATVTLVAMVSGLIGLIPMVAKQIGIGIVELLKAIGNSGAELTKAFVQIVAALLNGIIKLAPKIGQTMLVLLQTGLKVLVAGVPMMVRAGLEMLLGVLRGVRDNIGKIVSVAADIGINFINALAKKLPAIIQAGINFILSFVNGLADGIRRNSRAMGEAGGNLASAMVEGMINGLSGMAGKLIEEAKNLAKRAWNAAKEWLGIHSPSKKFAELGKFSGQGFVQGLKGTRADVKQAVTDMFDKLNTAITEHREKVSSESAKLKQLYKDRYENMRDIAAAQKRLQDAQNRQVGSTAKKASTRNAEIKREQDAKNKAIASAKENLRTQGIQQKAYDDKIRSSQNTLALYRGELDKMINARTALSGKLKDERVHLDALGKKYDDVTKRLEAANQKLKDATKVRDDYKNSIKDQYNDLPEITKETSLKDFVSNLEKKIVDTQQFTKKIGQLRAMGLNNDLYKELLAKGPDAMPFIDEVIKGGKNKVQQLNTLDSTLNRDAGTLANNASTSLYQAGVNAAQGLVDGLKKQQKAIDIQMERIAGYMVSVMKKKLGIKSPSRVFAELGSFTAEGLARGLDDTAGVVQKSAESVGQSAIDGMRKTITGLGALIDADVDVNPTIAPVLDLSSIRKDASGIASLLETAPLSIGASYSGASTASAGYSRNQAALAETVAPVEGDKITFVQNNTSPKALSSVEVYRQTNNQLSRAKGALTK